MKRTIVAILMLSFIAFGTGVCFAEKVTLATLNWQPFYGEDLEENGFFAALSREAFKRAGYEMELVFVPWKRALEMAKTGKYDGLLGAYYNEERAKEFFFTEPVSQNEESFVQKKGKGIKYDNLDNLKPYSIGGLRGSAPIEELRKKGFTVHDATDDIASIKMLNKDRIDLMISGKQQLLYNLKNLDELKQFSDSFEIIQPPFKSYDLFCPITHKREDGQEIVNKFNQALKEMKADGTYDEILKRFGQQG